MTLLEALERIAASQKEPGEFLRVSLLCSFTPLHFVTFLQAALLERFPGRIVVVKGSAFGDMAGSLRGEEGRADFLVVVLEWSDLDPRLGIRSSGSWDPFDLEDILDSSFRNLSYFKQKITALGEKTPLVLSLPSLRLQPIHFGRGLSLNSWAAALRQGLSSFALDLSGVGHVSIVDPEHLACQVPIDLRHDVSSDLFFGFPYSIEYASLLAEVVAEILQTDSPLKGLVTDLDDTLWKGILGEDGVEGVSWNLDGHSQIYGIYQKFLRSLARSGSLVAVASKNDASLVEEAFCRPDILLPRKDIFPLEANWGPKSVSIGRILHAWNIGEDAIVFIDDSPMEIAEVQSVFPKIRCRLFPKNDPAAVLALLRELRRLMGKEIIREEDLIRSKSLEVGRVLAATTDEESYEALLRESGSLFSYSLVKSPFDGRAFELVNKTNQFNLNGRRYTEEEWASSLSSDESILMTVTYEDRFGPLGKIAVLRGDLEGATLRVDRWVMSCRAFGRRIEHQMMECLFSVFNLDKLEFNYVPTERNGPVREFFRSVGGFLSEDRPVLSRKLWKSFCPALYHEVKEL